MDTQNDNFEERLAGGLKDLYAAPKFPGDDARILAAARSAGEAALRGHGRGRWRWQVGFGIAAAVALAAGLYWSEFRNGSAGVPSAAPPAALAASYTHTGDIRDAYFVARQLKRHQTLAAGWDSNGDGVVDQKDVQALALAAVRLPPEGLPELKGEVR